MVLTQSDFRFGDIKTLLWILNVFLIIYADTQKGADVRASTETQKYKTHTQTYTHTPRTPYTQQDWGSSMK